MNDVSQIMCVTGPCFDELPPWTVKTRHDVSQVPKRIKRAVKDFLHGELSKAPPIPQLDYWDQLDRMTSIPEHDHNADTVAELGHDLGPEFVMQRDRIHDTLRKGFPTASVQRPAGPQNVEPSPTAWFRWRRSHQIAMRPLVILDCLTSRFCTRDHAYALKTLYPDVYADIAQALIEGIQEASRKKTWRLSHKSDLALQAFLGVSAMSPGLAKDLQSNFKAEEQRQQQQAAASDKSASDRATTPTQRATQL